MRLENYVISDLMFELSNLVYGSDLFSFVMLLVFLVTFPFYHEVVVLPRINFSLVVNTSKHYYCTLY